MFARSCIIQIEAKARPEPEKVIQWEIKSRKHTQRTQNLKYVERNDTISFQQVDSLPLWDLELSWPTSGQPHFSKRVTFQAQIQWEVRQGLMRPFQKSHTSQIRETSIEMSIDQGRYGAFHLLCLHPQFIKQCQVNWLLLGQIQLSWT